MEQDSQNNLKVDVGVGEAENYFTFSLIYNDKDKSRPEFEVISFTGNENLSFVYDFNITLRSTTDNIPALLGEVLLRPAVLCIVVGNHFAYYHGIVTEFRQIKRVGDYTQYELRLRAKTFLPYLNTRSDIYVGKNFSEIIDGVMKDNGFTSLDYELKLTGSHYGPLPAGYNRWSYVCQYEENDLDFLQRLMEREGVYYYFEQDQTWRGSLQDVHQEKMIITDTKLSHPPAKKTLQYKPVGAPGPGPAPETIFTMIMHQAAFPAKVILRNYNYNTAGMGTMSATADVGPATNVTGRVQTIYGENFSTTEEGQTLAGIRAEEIFCQTKVYYGIASGPGLTPGTLIKIEDSGQTFSGDYLIIHADHAGQQPLPGIKQKFEYNNTFTMILQAVQFRPQRLTPKPKILATMNAVIDGDLSTETPDIDANFGRYKVRLPFAPETEGDDFSKKWGKSTDSYHVRMTSPYAGTEPAPGNKANVYGMHIPLHKGAEVVLSFRDGDPDLPVINGAVYNSQNFNVVTDKNLQQHVIQTQGGNKFVMDDTPGKQYISLFSPYGKEKGSWMYIGHGAEEEGLMHVKSSGNKHELTLGQETSYVIGAKTHAVVGAKMEALLGNSSELTLAMKTILELAGTLEFKGGHHIEFGGTKDTIRDKDDLLGKNSVTIAAGLPGLQEAALSGTAKTLLAIGAAGAALLASVGADYISGAAYPEEKENDPAAAKQMAVSLAVAAAGTIAQATMMGILIKKLKANLTDPISQMEMDASGIKIHTTGANSLGMPNSGVQLGIGPHMAAPTSLIKIAPTLNNNERISIENSNSTFISLVDGDFIQIIKTNGGNILINNNGVEIKQDNNGGKVTLNDTGGTMEKGTAKVAVSKTPNVPNSDKAELVVGANGFTTTATETKMVYAGKAIKMNAGSVDIGGAVTIVAT